MLERQPVNLEEKDTGKAFLLPAGGLAGALLASSCCVLPLVLVTLGVSGAWIANLTALARYQPVFLLLAIVSLAGGFWTVYRRPKVACPPGSYCASPRSLLISKFALWTASVLVIVALGADLLAPILI